MRSEDSAGNKYISLLHRVSRIVNSDLSVDEMRGQVVMLTAQVCARDTCIAYLLESATGDFVLRASQVPPAHGEPEDATRRGSYGMGSPAPIPVALTSKASGDSRFKPIAGLVEDSYQAFLSVPVVTWGKAIGVINVHHRDPSACTNASKTLICFPGADGRPDLGAEPGGTGQHVSLHRRLREDERYTVTRGLLQQLGDFQQLFANGLEQR